MWWTNLRNGRGRGPGLTGSAGSASQRTLRQECREVLSQMPVPRPFTLDGLIAGIEAERGRRIKLVAIPDHLLASTDVYGLWLQLDDVPVDLILYVDGTTAFHRQRIILHELAHLWCDDVTEASFEQLVSLLPDFPADLLQRLTKRGRIMARHRYDSVVERRAEMLADLLHHEAYDVDYIEDATLRHLDEDLSRLHFTQQPRHSTTEKNRVRL
ncbi:hypothetical protein [Streptomyces sp. NPDC017673]|uniref:hypothetical protein n=1 Tax=unclassified Streptomyces TaxID=2593676 RepID=UPI00378A832F